MVHPTTLYKFTAGLICLFCLNHIFVNEMFLNMNFRNLPEIDSMHNFLARSMGILGLFYSGLLVQLPTDVAEAVFKYQTLFIVTFYVTGPIMVYMTFEVDTMNFMPGLFLFGALVLTYLYTLATFKPTEGVKMLEVAE